MRNAFRFAALMLSLLVLSATTASAQAVVAPKIALNWTWSGRYLPLLYGQSKGFFKAANVAPDFIPTRGSDQALQLIESGQADYAFVDGDTFLAAAAQNKTTTTAVYVWIDKPSLDIVSLTPLKGPSAMTGKSFGTVPQSGARAMIPFILKQNKVDPKTVDVQALDFSVLFPLFLKGSIDTVEIHSPGSWQNLLAVANAQGKKLYLTRLGDWGLVGYDIVLLVRSSLLRDSPADVKRTVTAIDRSLKESIAHASDDDVYALLKDAMPQTPQVAVVGDWHDYKSLVQKPGAIDPRVFDRALHRLQDIGVINSVPAVGTLYANQVR